MNATTSSLACATSAASQEVQILALAPTGGRAFTDADSCELCAALADGMVLPPEHPMYDHPGCNCQPVPVLEGVA